MPRKFMDLAIFHSICTLKINYTVNYLFNYKIIQHTGGMKKQFDARSNQLAPNSRFHCSSSFHLLVCTLGLTTLIAFSQSPYLNPLTCAYIYLKNSKKNKLNMEQIILDLGFYPSISQFHREKKMIIYARITWFALTVRMFAPSSLIGTIAASSHKACRSLPEYPA